MKKATQDGGLRASGATLAESFQRPTRAKQAHGRSDFRLPKSPQRSTRSLEESGSLKHTSTAKNKRSARLSKKKPSETIGSRPSDDRYSAQKEYPEKSPSESVNDPWLLAMVDIELMRAELRVDFLNTFQVLDAEAVHRLAGGKGSDKSRKARAWRSAGRIIGLPIVGITVYPAFQFQPDGQPYPLIREVNKAFTKDCTDWQRASWLVSPNEWLNGETPVSAIQRSDPEVITAAKYACEVPVG